MEFNLNPGMFAAQPQFRPIDTSKLYDVLILGGGPAGLTAAVYCMRKGVSTGILLKEIGGQVALTAEIENYMGYRHVSGIDLVARFKEQVLQFGIDYEEGAEVGGIRPGDTHLVRLADAREIAARALVIATGKSWKRLNVPGEESLRGRGVAYCTTCDAPFFAGKRVAVVGGGNSGVEAAIDLARVAAEVLLVQFLDRLTADRVLVDRLTAFSNVKMLMNHEVTRISGSDRVEAITLRDRSTMKDYDLPMDGIFIEIGLVPNSAAFKDIVALNSEGEIMVDCACRTSVPGIFAAGDVTNVPFKQIIIAAGEGAKAALSACQYVMNRN